MGGRREEEEEQEEEERGNEAEKGSGREEKGQEGRAWDRERGGRKISRTEDGTDGAVSSPAPGAPRRRRVAMAIEGGTCQSDPGNPEIQSARAGPEGLGNLSSLSFGMVVGQLEKGLQTHWALQWPPGRPKVASQELKVLGLCLSARPSASGLGLQPLWMAHDPHQCICVPSWPPFRGPN